MQLINSRFFFQEIRSVESKVGHFLDLIHDVLDYPLVEDEPNIQNLRKRITEERNALKIFFQYPRQRH